MRRGSSTARGYALVLLAAACWAAGGLIAKWLFTTPGVATAAWIVSPLGVKVDPMVLSAARATLSALMVFAYLGLRRREQLRIQLRDLPFLVAFGVFGLALVHFAYFKAISLTGVATAILLEYLAPVIVLAFSVALLREKFTWALPVAVVLSVSGCALMVGALGETGLSVSPEGLGWGLASAVFFAGYTLMGRYAAGRFSPWTLLGYGLAAATLFWLVVLGGPAPILTLLSDGRAFAAVSVVAFVSTVVPFAAFLKALHMIEATRASVTSTVEPVIAGIIAWFIFGEHLDGWQILGAGLVIAAVLLSQARTSTPEELPTGT